MNQPKKFLRPPTVSGTLDMTTGSVDISNEGKFSPLPASVIKEIESILVPQNNPKPWAQVKNSKLNWSRDEEKLLKLRWRLQGTTIPELRRPDHPALKNFYTGRFSADEIGRKAMSLGLR